MGSTRIPIPPERLYCDLSVETLLSEGLIPVDAVIDALFGENSYPEVRLLSNFDPIPLRLKLKKMGCKIERQKSKEGWLFCIARDTPIEPTMNDQSLKKAKFKFDGEILNLDVMDIEYPNNFLEVIRFIDRSPEEEVLKVKISAFPKRFGLLLDERNWESLIEDEQADHVILILEKK